MALDLAEGVRERMDPVQVDELLDKHLELLFESYPGPTSTEWGGRLEDMELEKVSPAEGFVTDKEDFARLWKAWMGKEAVPAIDFDKQVVLVATSSKGRIWGLKLVNDKGGAQVVARLAVQRYGGRFADR